MKTGIKKIAFYDPLTGTTVQLNTISTESVITIREPYSVEDGSGNMIYAGEQSQVEATAFDADGYAQLKTWMENETELNMVAYGVEAHILWYENAPITVKQNIGSAVGNRNSFTVTIAAKGGVQDIHFGSNLLFFAKGWADSDSDGTADGYTIDASDDFEVDFASERQEIDSTEALTDLEMYTNIVFPISGIGLTFFSNVIASASLVGNIKVIEKNFAGATLSTNTSSSFEANLEVETDSGIYSLDVYLIETGAMDDGETTKFDLPYLGIKTSGIINY